MHILRDECYFIHTKGIYITPKGIAYDLQKWNLYSLQSHHWNGQCEVGVKRRKVAAAVVAAAVVAMSSVVAEPAALESDSVPSESLPLPRTSVRSSSSFSSIVVFLLLILTLCLTIFLPGPSPVLDILPPLCSILLFRACLPLSLPHLSAYLPLSLPYLSACLHGPFRRSPSLLHRPVVKNELTHCQGSEGCLKFQHVALSSVLAGCC